MLRYIYIYNRDDDEKEKKRLDVIPCFVFILVHACALCPFKVCPYRTLCGVASFSLSAIFGDNAASCNAHTRLILQQRSFIKLYSP